MSTDSWLAIAVAGITLVIFGLAAFVESSLATVNRLTLRELIEERAGPHHVQSLIDRPQVVRSTMLLVELISAVVIAITLTGVFRQLVPAYGTWVAFASSAVSIMIIRGIARAAASTEYDTDSPAIKRIARPLKRLAAPAVLTTDLVTKALAPLFRQANGNGEAGTTNGEERERADDSQAEALDLEEDEQEMISGILGLEEATAREIMVPRMDIIAVPIEATVNDVVDIVRVAGHSRIPVFRETIDAIVGMVYAKDLLRFVREETGPVKLIDLLRPAYFVPESKRVDELLKDLQQEKVHLAIVVDEYGGTAGLVTIEDILEEIVGEIQDEYDREVPMVERVGAEEVLVDGRISLDEIGEIFETEFADRESGTVGGFVQRTLGRIPKAGESVEANGLLIEVRAVEHHRIRKLRIVRMPDQEPDDAEHQAGAA